MRGPDRWSVGNLTDHMLSKVDHREPLGLRLIVKEVEEMTRLGTETRKALTWLHCQEQGGSGNYSSDNEDRARLIENEAFAPRKKRQKRRISAFRNNEKFRLLEQNSFKLPKLAIVCGVQNYAQCTRFQYQQARQCPHLLWPTTNSE